MSYYYFNVIQYYAIRCAHFIKIVVGLRFKRVGTNYILLYSNINLLDSV